MKGGRVVQDRYTFDGTAKYAVKFWVDDSTSNPYICAFPNYIHSCRYWKSN